MRKGWVGLAVLALLAVGACLYGCGPSAEERTVIEVVNNQDVLTQRDAHVKRVTFLKNDPGDKKKSHMLRYEAEVFDTDGKSIGRLRGQRVEGFGTMRPRVQWYQTPGKSEPWDEQRANAEREERRRQRQQQRDQQKQQP
jgi:hypothetical protein